MKLLRWLLIVAVGIAGLFVMRSMLGILLFIAIVVVDLFMMMGILVHCDGRCRSGWRVFFKDYRPRLRKYLIWFNVILLLTIPPLPGMIVSILMAAYIGWFNTTYWALRWYLKED